MILDWFPTLHNSQIGAPRLVQNEPIQCERFDPRHPHFRSRWWANLIEIHPLKPAREAGRREKQ